ncbi:hypothetical protein L0337_18335 [candidate division KSB1 bacterium]|nr:hypothetical protein [candidate division KSB1 bacterium]
MWLGAAYTRLGFGEQTITSETGPEPLGKFEPYESNFSLAAIRFGRFWYGGDKFGFNTFGYSIGPPGLRFSFARFALFESLFIDEWHIYTVSVGMSKLPF